MAVVKIKKCKTMQGASGIIHYMMKDGSIIGGKGVKHEDAEHVLKSVKNLKNISLKRGSVEGYHIIQSFKPGEIEPKEAHKIAERLMNETQPDGQYLICTHIDKDHIHNHIFLNSDLTNGKKVRGADLLERTRDKSDSICQQNNLTVVHSTVGEMYGKAALREGNGKTKTAVRAENPLC